MFKLCQDTIQVEQLKASMAADAAGAFVGFEGWVRDRNDGRSVVSLEYEAYDGLAVPEGLKILEECREKFDIIDVRCVHRTGLLSIGEIAVWVGVTSMHRGDAFKACQYVIDEVKLRLPIWKKETYTDGSSGWVNCSGCASHEHEPVLAHEHKKSKQEEVAR